MSDSSSSDDSIDESDEQTSDGDTTTSTATRHPYTNDVLASILVITLVVLAILYATGVAAATDIPRMVTDVLSLATLTAVVWSFGPEMMKEAAAAFGGK